MVDDFEAGGVGGVLARWTRYTLVKSRGIFPIVERVDTERGSHNMAATITVLRLSFFVYGLMRPFGDEQPTRPAWIHLDVHCIWGKTSKMCE